MTRQSVKRTAAVILTVSAIAAILIIAHLIPRLDNGRYQFSQYGSGGFVVFDSQTGRAWAVARFDAEVEKRELPTPNMPAPPTKPRLTWNDLEVSTQFILGEVCILVLVLVAFALQRLFLTKPKPASP